MPEGTIIMVYFPLKLHRCISGTHPTHSITYLQVCDDREVLRHRAPPQALLGQKVPPPRLRRRRPPLQRPQVLRVREKGGFVPHRQ